MKSTTVKINGRRYPFYRTNRGQFDFENAGYSIKDLADGKVSAMLAYIYYSLKACAKRAGLPLDYKNLDDFVDKTDESILEVFTSLAAEDNENENEATTDTEGNPTPAVG